MVNEVRLHPPHMVDSSGSLTPAALIPFCAYQTNMTLLGQTRPDLPFTFCSQFQPKVLEGQLCYSLDLSLLDKSKTNNGLKHGLVLILDSGTPGMSKSKPSRFRKGDTTTSLNLETASNAGNSARIYLNTLASFTDSRAGSFAMSVLKKTKGTKSFMNLPDNQKNCQIGTLENCQSQWYIKEVVARCGCVPWALSSGLSLTSPTFCSPNASDCYTAVIREDHNCLVSCTGLFADVRFTEDRLLAENILEDITAKGKTNQLISFKSVIND